MRGHEDRERGDGENPITTACIDVLLDKYFDYYMRPGKGEQAEETEDRATLLQERKEKERRSLKWLEKNKPAEFRRFDELMGEIKAIRKAHRRISTADSKTIARYIELRRERRSILNLAQDNQ